MAIHSLLRSTLPDLVVAGAAAVFAAGATFLAVAPATPFRIVPMTVLFVAAGAGAAIFVALVGLPTVLRTTVPVLQSLDSLTALTRRAVLVTLALVGAVASHKL